MRRESKIELKELGRRYDELIGIYIKSKWSDVTVDVKRNGMNMTITIASQHGLELGGLSKVYDEIPGWKIHDTANVDAQSVDGKGIVVVTYKFRYAGDKNG